MNFFRNMTITCLVMLVVLNAAFISGVTAKDKQIDEANDKAKILQEEITELQEEPTEPVEQPTVTEVTKVTKVTETTEVTNYSVDDIEQIIRTKSEEYGIDSDLVMAIVHQESSFRPDVISAGGDWGLMQINKVNHAWLSETLGITNFLDPEQNVTAGLYILRNLFDKYDDPSKVLMAYNMGEAGARKHWDKGVYSSNYSEAVISKWNEYKEGKSNA